jgi:hypothetical protein
VDNPDGDPRGVGYTHTVFAAPDRLSTARVGYNMVWLSVQPTTHVMPRVQPQNPTTRWLTVEELAAVRSELAKMLADDNCRAFIDKLVTLNTGKPFDSRSLLDYFDNTVKSAEGGVFFAPGDGGLSRQRREDYPITQMSSGCSARHLLTGRTPLFMSLRGKGYPLTTQWGLAALSRAGGMFRVVLLLASGLGRDRIY